MALTRAFASGRCRRLTPVFESFAHESRTPEAAGGLDDVALKSIRQGLVSGGIASGASVACQRTG